VTLIADGGNPSVVIEGPAMNARLVPGQPVHLIIGSALWAAFAFLAALWL